MGAGMPPIAIGWGGSDPSFRSPLAVIGARSIASAFLGLLVMPAVFPWVDDRAAWFNRRWRGHDDHARARAAAGTAKVLSGAPHGQVQVNTINIIAVSA